MLRTGWVEKGFREALTWVREQGICEIGICALLLLLLLCQVSVLVAAHQCPPPHSDTSPEGNQGNKSWSRHVAPWMLDAVSDFLSAPCSCKNCACTNCSIPKIGW